MKSNHIILSVLSLFICTVLFAQKKETVKVWGNCGMCKKTIEAAAKSSGAVEADWNTETKILSVVYNSDKSSLAKIEQAVAAAGYDTKNFKAPEASYNDLPDCCQYDRKLVGIKTSLAIKNDDCCKEGKCTSIVCMKDGKCAACNCCKDGKCTKDTTTTGKSGDCCKDTKASAASCCKKS